MPKILAVARIMVRGFIIVFLTATNVTQVAGKHYAGAFVVGSLISITWWINSKKAGRSDDIPFAQLAYGLGAGIGTISGMALTGWYYGR